MSNDQHANPTREEPLTPPETASPTHAERARTLVGQLRTGTLSTLDAEGFPHGSYITFALDGPDPVFLISRLATHTQNLLGSSRASLMAHEARAEDPLANGRVTLIGHCRQLDEAAAIAGAREAYLAAHPQSAYYADFKDFGFWKLTAATVRYIGGYGRMSWVDVADWRAAQPDPLARDAEGIVEHMNQDHADALVAYARAFTRAVDASVVRMTGIDRYGFELSVETAAGPRPARLAFGAEITTSTGARQALIALLKTARERLA